MKKALRPSHGILDQNAAFLRMLLFYLFLLLIIAAIACQFSYKQKDEELDSQTDLILTGLDREYRDITSSFWKLYMPLFETRTSVQQPLSVYFSGQELSRSLYKDLEYAMTQMALRDERVAWLAFYSPLREKNYILLADSRQLQTYGEEFPYLSQLHGRNMKVLGLETMPGMELSGSTFAMCSGLPTTMGQGFILAGYRTNVFEKICAGYDFLLDSARYELISGGALVYSSAGDVLPRLEIMGAINGTVKDPGGDVYYVKSSTCGDKDSFLVFSALERERNIYKYQMTFLILLLVLLFAALSVLFYLLTLRVITREVNVIRQGLRRISENDMSTPIESEFQQAGLYSIAQAVNEMAQRLDRTLNRAHYYRLRQKEAELSDLQSKFNPHFLNNTLEMLRNRCEAAGAEEVAGMITDFSAIFRGLIGSKTFIPLREELAATHRYLSLLGARYEDQVTIRYDITRDVLQYGIIRNVFQPLIENYFQYGFTTANQDNEILISGKIQDNGMMELSVEDNGTGMSESDIEALRLKLQQPAQESRESYGLKNLNQRLKLFYGDECGLRVEANQGRGLKVTILALAMTCEEYENSQAFPSTLKEEDFHENNHCNPD
ncbi:MAG: histidine kinase [Clostridia bacterium]|nr:histidine kinase [Clostridia bacterium]